MTTSPRVHRISLCLVVALCLCSSLRLRAQDIPATPAKVWTWHNDNGRTGQNTGETSLTPNNVNKQNFGQLCSYPVDGQGFAQPLVLWDSSNSRNLVYVVTQNDSVYMFDGTNIPQSKQCTVLASALSNGNGTAPRLIPTNETAVDCHNIGNTMCMTISPKVGILGTPVIDEKTNHIYVVTYSQTATSSFTFRIHALCTGLTSLDGCTTPLGEDGTYNSPAIISSSAFVPGTHIQRPGLLLLPNTQSLQPYVYVAFSLMDGATTYPPGFIFRFNGDDLSTSLVYTTEPTTGKAGGGIWMDGAGLAAGIDSTGGQTYLYFTTADGDFDPNTSLSKCVDCGDSFVKLTYSLGLNDGNYFTPCDWNSRFSSSGTNPDYDFGSGGVLLIPDNLLTSWPYLAVSADKAVAPATSGHIWVMPRRGSRQLRWGYELRQQR